MYFDAKAESWDTEARIERAKIIALEIKKAVNPQDTWNALEFGCGTGLVSLNLAEEFRRITMIDSSRKMIGVLKRKIASLNAKNLVALHATIDFLLAQNERFDIIYTSMALHHVTDIPDMIAKFVGLAAPNGRLCVIDLLEEDGSFHAHEHGFEGHNGFDPESLKNELAKNGFGGVSWHEFYKIQKPAGEYGLFILTGSLSGL